MAKKKPVKTPVSAEAENIDVYTNNHDEIVVKNAEVVAAYKGVTFGVRIPQFNREIMCTLNGKLKLNYIKILVGDKVDVAINPADVTKGRIIWRHK